MLCVWGLWVRELVNLWVCALCFGGFVGMRAVFMDRIKLRLPSLAFLPPNTLNRRSMDTPLPQEGSLEMDTPPPTLGLLPSPPMRRVL